MKCAEVKNLVELYVAGELDEAARAVVAGHLKTCPECAQEETVLSALSDNLNLTFQSLDPSPNLTSRIMDACQARPRYVLRVATALAAVLLITVVISFVLSLAKPSDVPLHAIPQAHAFSDGSRMLISTDAVWNVTGPGSKIELQQGSLYLNIVSKDRQAPRGDPVAVSRQGWCHTPGVLPFVITTPAGTVTTYQAEFVVGIDNESSKVSVLVLNGKVSLSNPQGNVVGLPHEFLYALYAEENSPPSKQGTSDKIKKEIAMAMEAIFQSARPESIRGTPTPWCPVEVTPTRDTTKSD